MWRRKRPQPARRPALDRLALEADLALAPEQAQKGEAERGLARAALADHAERLALADLQIDPVDRLDVADRAAQQAALDREMRP